MTPKCKATIDGKRCHRKATTEHIDALGLKGWRLRHRYKLCRKCSKTRDEITLAIQRGAPVSTVEPFYR